MVGLDKQAVWRFARERVVQFHERRLARLDELLLRDVLKKNPYLFRAKNAMTAQDLIQGTLDAFLSSSEEKTFGDLLEDLALFVSE